jgi:hypothetical protein
MKKSILLLFGIGILFAASAQDAQAARLIFEKNSNRVANGIISISVKLDAEGENINAFEGAISFTPHLVLVSVADTDVLAPMWHKPPALRDSLLTFAGIIPGGYEGSMSTAWKGTRPERLMTLTFRALQTGTAKISLDNVQILLNDGKATPAAINPTEPLTFEIMPEHVARQAEDLIRTDLFPPEAFTPEIRREAAYLEGKYFVVFSAQDRQSGIDHYEIAELSIQVENSDPRLVWRVAQSPYILKDQTLSKFVYVKAVDRQGNEAVVVIPPTVVGKASFTTLALFIIVLVAGGIALLLFKRKIRRKNQG